MNINRCLDDHAMDHIDHALGRPLDPMGETFRNFFAASGEIADELAASPFWDEGPRGREMRFFHVNNAGRKALAAHLRQIGDRHRAYSITFDGHMSRVIATTKAKARYSHYLDISDVMPDLTFKDYCRRTSVAAGP